MVNTIFLLLISNSFTNSFRPLTRFKFCNAPNVLPFEKQLSIFKFEFASKY